MPPLTLPYLPNNKIPDVKHEHIHYHIQADGGTQYHQHQQVEPSLGSYLANAAQSATAGGGQDPGYAYSDRPSALTGSVPGQPSYYGQFRSEDNEPYFPVRNETEPSGASSNEQETQKSSYKFVITNTFPFFAKVSLSNELDTKPSSFRKLEDSDEREEEFLSKGDDEKVVNIDNDTDKDSEVPVEISDEQKIELKDENAE